MSNLPPPPSGSPLGATPGGEGPAATRNRLLKALPPEEVAWFAPHLERVALEIGDVLVEWGGESLRHVSPRRPSARS